ncbi:hypothetical protein GCM10010345_91040 [Streptomyces canarius]|uniref:Uncharacterized protein n=1 Tax=Streptomyces canarius TaxID=285453 RepID=A0ABQ3DCL5_9ACTN|nr:hypothetical protein GCM10010345_91040 [Streptomyces canarius]
MHSRPPPLAVGLMTIAGASAMTDSIGALLSQRRHQLSEGIRAAISRASSTSTTSYPLADA